MKKGTLFCFSPAVMIITAAIELALAAVAYWKYRKTPLGVLVTFTLLFLGLFQAAEYQICEGVVSQNLLWTKIGLASITMLPAIGLHMVQKITGRKHLYWFGYLCAAIYVGLFVLTSSVVQGGTCEGNYVIIHTKHVWYGLYYFGFLLLGLAEGFSALWHKRVGDAKHREALVWLMIGYLSFILPTGVVYLLEPSILSGMPSIMCGFALILALILAGRVLPVYHGESS